MPFLLSLQYPVTRSFPGRIFPYTTFAGAIVILVVLTVINAAVAGYETVPNFNSDFNVTQNLWFDRFLPRAAKHKPGSLCDSRLLGLGDTITTNYTMFQYSISAINIPNAGDSGFSYQGWTLDSCDITSLFVNGDANTFMIDFTALVMCKANEFQARTGNNFEIIARTDWSESYLAGTFGSPLGAQKALRNTQAGTYNKLNDARGSVLNTLMGASSNEFADRVFAMLALSDRTTPQILSFEAAFPWCPASLGRNVPCATQVPPLNITAMFEWLGNGAIVRGSGDLLTNDTLGIISNMAQAVYAAVRLDLGNTSPNNFLLNTTMIPQAIMSTFPQTYASRGGVGLPTESYLYSVLVNDGNFSRLTDGSYDIPGLLPLSVPGPAVLDGVYLCRFQRAKSPGSAFIAVLVGTLSMFSAVWGIYMTLAATFVKYREPTANVCEDAMRYEHEKQRFMDPRY